MSDERLVSVAEVASLVGLSAKAVRRAVERGELPASKLCGRIRVRREDVDAWVESNQVRPRAAPARPTRLPAANGLRSLLADNGRETEQ
jgi:excisionase family DNA binding protein